MPEKQLRASQAVAVAVPPGRLVARDQDGAARVRPAAAGPLAASLPIIARAPPTVELRVCSETACCSIAIGRVEVRVDGMRLGQTPLMPDSSERCEVCLEIPKRPLDVTLELSGRKVAQHHLSGELPETLTAEVPVAVYVYVTLVDAEQGLEFVSVCGHKLDFPDDPPARPFIGEVRWDGGSTRVKSLQQAVVLGGASCLKQLQSLRLSPDLPADRCYEAVEWQDTGDLGDGVYVHECQYKRLLNNPVRVGKIFPRTAA